MCIYDELQNFSSCKRPLVIIGAGFSNIFCPDYRGTNDIIEEGLKRNNGLFPALSTYRDINKAAGCSMKLDNIWTDSNKLSEEMTPHFDNVIKQYATSPSLTNEYYLYNKTFKQCTSEQKQRLLKVILELELKKIISTEYSSEFLYKNIKTETTNGFNNIIKFLSTKKTSWISFNYDITLEYMLTNRYKSQWRYCFEEWLRGNEFDNKYNHIISKPHGSLNLTFKTNWKANHKTSIEGNTYITYEHKIRFSDRKDRLQTFPAKKFGGKPHKDRENVIYEHRPCLIGYIPDEQKEELNSRVFSSDIAHDLCKANVAFSTISIQRADLIIILGYSVPKQDTWLLSRLAAKSNKKCPIYIASGSANEKAIERILNLDFARVTRFKSIGDNNVQP